MFPDLPERTEFPIFETAGAVRSKHVNLLDSHRPIISASPDFKSRVCRALPSDARKSPAPSVRSLARGAETPRGSPSRVRRVLASNLDPSDPSRARRRCRRAGHPPTPPDLTVTRRGRVHRRGVLRGTRCRWSGRARPTARDRRRRGPAMVIRIRRNTKRGTRGELTGQRTHPGRVLPSSCTRFRHASKSRATEFLKFGDCRRCDDEIQTRELGFGPTFVVKLPQLRDFFRDFFIPAVQLTPLPPSPVSFPSQSRRRRRGIPEIPEARQAAPAIARAHVITRERLHSAQGVPRSPRSPGGRLRGL